MHIKLTNQADSTLLSNYISIKYKNFNHIDRFHKNIEENTIEVSFTNGDDRMNNEKDFINSVKQFSSDSNISYKLSY